MSAPEKPGPGDGEVMKGLPRTRPQRRSSRRAESPARGAAGATPDPGTTTVSATPEAAPVAQAKAAAKPRAKAPAKPRAKAPASAKAASTAKGPAAAKTKAKATKPKVAAARGPKAATPTDPRPLDHPVPADLPGAPFAPPPPGKASDAPEPRRPEDDGHDVLGLALRTAGEVAQAGVAVARTLLGRLPRP